MSSPQWTAPPARGSSSLHTPRWPLVSAIVRPKAIGAVSREMTWTCIAIAGGATDPSPTAGGSNSISRPWSSMLGLEFEPGVYEGFGVPVASSTTTRDDYSDRMGTFRGNVTKREELRLFPEEGGFTYNRDEAVREILGWVSA